MNDFLNRERERRRIQAATAKSAPIEFQPEHMAALQTLATKTGMSLSAALSVLLETALSASRVSYFTDIMNAAFVQQVVADGKKEEPMERPKPDCLVCGHPVHARIDDGVPVPALCVECGCSAALERQAPPTQNESMQPEPGEDPEHFRARLQALARGEKQEEPS